MRKKFVENERYYKNNPNVRKVVLAVQPFHLKRFENMIKISIKDYMKINIPNNLVKDLFENDTITDFIKNIEQIKKKYLKEVKIERYYCDKTETLYTSIKNYIELALTINAYRIVVQLPEEMYPTNQDTEKEFCQRMELVCRKMLLKDDKEENHSLF